MDEGNTKSLSEVDFPGRSWERDLVNPLIGDSMLELGNKRKGNMIYKHVFERAGFRHVSVDINGKDGALKVDLRKPLNLGTFDMVTNFGTSEHVSENSIEGQVVCWQNILEAMHVGSVLVSITPREGAPRWLRHGRWYPQEPFFTKMAEINGLEIERLYRDEHLIYCRAVRVEDKPFVFCADGLYRNPNNLIPQIQ